MMTHRCSRWHWFGVVLALLVIAAAFAADGADDTLDPITLRTPKTYPAERADRRRRGRGFLRRAAVEGKAGAARLRGMAFQSSSLAETAPAMVLVHGGGETAFAEWVRLWVSRGYAAIAVDTCGAIPKGSHGNWERHAFGGPAGWGGLEPADVEQPPTDQWTYHAVSDVALAHSLLRSLPGVDPDRVGVTGISWGGYLTCISAGLDKRYKLAVPVYGCGFLGGQLDLAAAVQSNGPESGRPVAGHVGPLAEDLPNATLPMLWVTGTNDVAFPMDSLQKSSRSARKGPTLCLTIGINYSRPRRAGRKTAGDPRICRRHPEPRHTPGKVDRPRLRRNHRLGDVRQQDKSDSRGVDLHDRRRPVRKARMEIAAGDVGPKAGEARRGTLPEKVTMFYLSMIDDRGLTVSSEHEERGAVGPATKKP